MRVPACILILVFAATGYAIQAEPKQLNANAPTSTAFADSVAKYVGMLQELNNPTPGSQKTTNESEQIAERQRQMIGLIANARRGAHQGEFFRDDVAAEFRSIIRQAFQEPGGEAMRQTILERDPVRSIALKVNEVYPDDQPRTTMPPTLLNRLPVLPKELQYRIVGRALVLQHTETSVIVDFILNAIP